MSSSRERSASLRDAIRRGAAGYFPERRRPAAATTTQAVSRTLREAQTDMARERNKFTVGLVQMRCGADPQSNLERATVWVRQAAQSGAQIICLPELFRSQYFCQRQDPSIFDLAESIPGPTTERLGRVARDTGTVVVASVFE